MSFPTTITITDGVTPRDLDTISVQSQTTIRRDADDGLNAPFTMKIATTEQKNGSFRHLVRLDDVDVIDAETNTRDLAAAYIVIEQPITSVAEDRIVYLVEALKGFLTSANVVKLLNGES